MNEFSQKSRAESTERGEQIQFLRNILGNAVLIPVTPLTKKPSVKEWQKFTFAAMSDPAHLKHLLVGNIGVVLGRASAGLCTIDLDCDEDVEPFLAKNPCLRNTTRTKRVRGCNFWVRISGEYPGATTLKDGERRIGEWRADGGMTVIFGAAIDRKKGETQPTEYRFINDAPPICIRFGDLMFPDGCAFTNPTTTHLCLPPASGYCVAASLPSCVPASLHNNNAAILGNLTARNEARRTVEARRPELGKLYDVIVEPRFPAVPGGRNDFLNEAIPFLYRAVAERFILDLVGHFYDRNRALFHDPRADHMRSAEHLLQSVARTYLESLSEGERAIYHALAPIEQDTFRICRDLALLPTPQREPLTFFLSFDQLALRLGIFPMQALRIMRQLQGQGLLRMLKRGARRQSGEKAEASTYRWLVASPEQNQPAIAA